jgi:ABC-2 type transport system ATP-binding protein
LRAEGMTLIVSSHILAELDEYSSHMLAIKDGRAVEFRALEATAETGVTLRIVFAHAPADEAALNTLLGTHGMSAVHPAAVAETGWAVQGTFKGTAASQAMLLKSLVGADLGAMEFSVVRENLHESYLRSMRSEAPREGNGSAPVMQNAALTPTPPPTPPMENP